MVSSIMVDRFHRLRHIVYSTWRVMEVSLDDTTRTETVPSDGWSSPWRGSANSATDKQARCSLMVGLASHAWQKANACCQNDYLTLTYLWSVPFLSYFQLVRSLRARSFTISYYTVHSQPSRWFTLEFTFDRSARYIFIVAAYPRSSFRRPILFSIRATVFHARARKHAFRCVVSMTLSLITLFDSLFKTRLKIY